MPKTIPSWFNSYYWLEHHLPKFLLDCKVRGAHGITDLGLISAHGDKFRGYKSRFEEVGLHVVQGGAIYLLTYTYPYAQESRETKDQGWVAPVDWVCQNKDRFIQFLPEVDETNPLYRT